MLQSLKSKRVRMSKVVKEYESRIMLTESEYFEIVSHFMRLHPEKHFLKNVNIYFDTPDYYLKNNHINLRVRIINDAKCEFTMKIAHPEGDDEINDYPNIKEIDALLKEGIFPNGDVKRYLLTLPYHLADYKQITTLTTIRLEIENDDHLLVIDKNSYGDIIDYNLEVEAKDSILLAKARLKEYMKQFNIAEPQQKYVGKSHRAINAAIKKS